MELRFLAPPLSDTLFYLYEIRLSRSLRFALSIFLALSLGPLLSNPGSEACPCAPHLPIYDKKCPKNRSRKANLRGMRPERVKTLFRNKETM